MLVFHPDIQIIRAGPFDAAAARQLTRIAYEKWLPVSGHPPMPMPVDHNSAVTKHMIDLLAVGDDYVAMIETIENVDHLRIGNMAVAPAFQGKGYGRLLALHAESLAAALSYREIRLRTNKAFAANIRLYSGLGYTIDREEACRGGSIVHMRKAV